MLKFHLPQLSSAGDKHNEFDFEFLGNVTGEPYLVQTNLYIDGVGNREQRIDLWFDPTADFHTYAVLWNPSQVVFMVDDTPIRVYENRQNATTVRGHHRHANGTTGSSSPFPGPQPMAVYSSIWNADDWATQGGRVKTDWSQAPFTAYFRNYRASGCEPSGVAWACGQDPSGGDWFDGGAGLDDVRQRQQLREAQERYTIYDYCTDSARFPNGGFPKECGLP